jgi:formate dehydrogenase major subunit
MGALPNKLPGFQDIEKNDAARLRFEAAWGVPIEPKYGWHLTQMLNAMQRGELRTLYCIGENPAQSEADTGHTVKLLGGLDFLCVQDMFLTRTAELAHVVLPASAAWCETDGTVTNSERRVQRTRKALDPPAGVKSDVEILCDLASRLGQDWGQPSAEQIWNELRSLSPMHTGMSYARLEQLGGIAWPCPTETHPGSSFLHGRLWETDPEKRGAPAPFSIVLDEPPLDEVNEEYPFVLTTGRRLDSYNTGVQTGALRSPIRVGEVLDISPADAASMGIVEGDPVRITSRRGHVVAPIRLDPGLRSGLVFMTFHFPDEINVNILTNEAADPRSGTSEYKAAAVRVEPVITLE